MKVTRLPQLSSMAFTIASASGAGPSPAETKISND
jgi:hypothetical protein